LSVGGVTNSSAPAALTDSRLAALCAETAHQGYLDYETRFHQITGRARQRFLARDLHGTYADAAERLHLYSNVLAGLTNKIDNLMGSRLRERDLWTAIKAVYSSLIAQSSAWEIAESFFNSLTRRVFTTERARAFLAGNAAHSMLPLERRPSAGFGLALLTMGHAVGWPFARGGAQSLADALADRLRAAGGQIRVSSPVDELPRADVVLCDVSPRELLRLGRFPAKYERALRRYRYGPGAFKLDWALSGPIPWRDERCGQAATVHLGGTSAEIAASERAPGSGRPFVLLAQPSLWDDTRAPAGQHTAWGY